MSTGALELVLDPGLVEEAVLLAIRRGADLKDFHAARDVLYQLPHAERERAFTELHFSWFQRLGLARPVHHALAELPIIARSCARVVVSRALTTRDEGADLLVNSDLPGPGGRTVLIRLRASALSEADSLLAMLRRELLHVADMVDPEFGYEPEVKAADYGPAYAQLVRERYRVLWDVTVAGRLMGGVTPDAKADAYRAFVAAFPMLGVEAEAAFARFFHPRDVTHAEMMSFAASPRSRAGDAGLAPGLPCPLCELPTFSPELEPERLPPEVVASIIADFPAWEPRRGLCRQCGDLYRARSALDARNSVNMSPK